MLNMMGTGFSRSEAEGKRALPNGAKIARCIAKTVLAVFTVLGTWPEPSLEAVSCRRKL